MDEEFEAANGKTMSRRAMGYAVWKRGAEIERTDKGFVVDGIVYRPIDDAE